MALCTVSILTGVPWALWRRIKDSWTSAADGIEGHNRYATVVRITIELPKTDTVITFACEIDSGRNVLGIGRLDVVFNCIAPAFSTLASDTDTLHRDASIQLVVHGVLIGHRV